MTIELSVAAFARIPQWMFRRKNSGDENRQTAKRPIDRQPRGVPLLTDGIELPGPCQGRSVAFKELEQRADLVFDELRRRTPDDPRTTQTNNRGS
jgi:hypothetical protein